MADLNISDFSSKVQNYLRENIDVNGDDKINEGSELNALLSGDTSKLSNTDTVNLSASRRVYMNDTELVKKSIDNYNAKSPADRAPIVEATEIEMEARLEALDKTIDSSYTQLNDYLDNPPIRQVLVPIGGQYSLEQLWEEAINDNLDTILEGVQEFRQNAYLALQTFVPGNDLYHEAPLIGVDTYKILDEMGFDSMENFAKKVAEESELLSEIIQGGPKPSNSTADSSLYNDFLEKVVEQYKQAASDARNSDEEQAYEFRTGYRNTKPQLEATIQDGIKEYNAISDYSTRRVFENQLIKSYNEDTTGIENTTTDRKPDKDGFVKCAMQPFGVVLMNKETGEIKSLNGSVIKPARE